MSNISNPKYKLPNILNLTEVTASSGFNGNIIGSASYALDSDKLDGLSSESYAKLASQNTYLQINTFNDKIIINSSLQNGLSSLAIGQGSHAEGLNTESSGNYSHTEGNKTVSVADYQHVEGHYNQTSSTALYIIGNGTSDSTRSNIFEVYTGSVTINGILKTTPTPTPKTTSSPGEAGEICWDANYIYVCTGLNTWKSASLG